MTSDEKKGRAIIVVLFLALLVLEGARLLIDYGPWRDALAHNTMQSKYPMVDPARQFYNPADLIINIQPLRDELSEIGKNSNVSIYFESFNTGANIAVNKDAEYFPASLLKVPLVMAVVKGIEQGKYKWTDEFVLTEQDKNKDFGDLWQNPIGTSFTIEELVKKVLISSDNTAYFMLFRNIDPNDFNQAQNDLGMKDFFSKNLEISAKRYAPILRSLFSASYLSIANSQKLLEWMSEAQFKDYLVSGVPSSVKISHKIGIEDKMKDNEDVYLDASIVYLSNKPYLLIVMVKGESMQTAKNLMKDISQKVYAYMTKSKNTSR